MFAWECACVRVQFVYIWHSIWHIRNTCISLLWILCHSSCVQTHTLTHTRSCSFVYAYIMHRWISFVYIISHLAEVSFSHGLWVCLCEFIFLYTNDLTQSRYDVKANRIISKAKQMQQMIIAKIFVSTFMVAACPETSLSLSLSLSGFFSVGCFCHSIDTWYG